MGNRILLIVFCLSSFFLNGQGFVVKDFSAEYYLKKEGYVDVKETYEVEFTEQRHGLLRHFLTKIDFKNSKGEHSQRSLYFSKFDVPNETFDAPLRFWNKYNDVIELKIGDADKFVFGKKKYTIHYRVENALIFDGDQVQFYWNAKPAEWESVFEKISYKIHAPKGVQLNNENCFVYAGSFGDSMPSKQFTNQFNNGVYHGISQANFRSNYGESVTLLVKLPRNSIAEIDYSPSFLERFGWIFVVGGMIFWFYRTWVKYGKDHRSIVAVSYYPPKGIDPAMAGYLIDDSDDAIDLISLLPKWGSEGLISIEEIEKSSFFGSADTRLTKLNDLKDISSDYEQTVFNGLFKNASNNEKGQPIILMSELENKFYSTFTIALKQLATKALKYYEPVSEKKMVSMILINILLAFFGGFILFMFTTPLGGISVFITGIVLSIMSKFMRKKTLQGSEILSELKGFKQFIEFAEVDRIKTLIESDPSYFEKTMSYALAFGLLAKWAKKFEGLNIQPPNWYHGSTMNAFAMSSFANSFSKSISHIQSTSVSTPSSSGSGGGGGGFSGGGFGGGGGGSW